MFEEGEDHDHCYVVTQPYKLNLLEYVQANQYKIDETQASNIAKQMLQAVHYLHSQNIAHMSISPS